MFELVNAPLLIAPVPVWLIVPVLFNVPEKTSAPAAVWLIVPALV
jgi:hypothetical protein